MLIGEVVEFEAGRQFAPFARPPEPFSAHKAGIDGVPPVHTAQVYPVLGFEVNISIPDLPGGHALTLPHLSIPSIKRLGAERGELNFMRRQTFPAETLDDCHSLFNFLFAFFHG
jgi:hypothetical protein